jgi:hypothetical protein
MTPAPIEEWQFWEALSISRLPLSFILDPKKRSARTQMIGSSDAAFVHRMFDLFFTMRQDWVLERLSLPERHAFQEFDAVWSSLPWTSIPGHPHVSEVPDSKLQVLVPVAKHLDRLLALRTEDRLVPIVYRVWRGWKKLRMPRSPKNA